MGAVLHVYLAELYVIEKINQKDAQMGILHLPPMQMKK